MRIAYVGRWAEDPPDGVCLKVHGQAEEWRRHGHDVQLFGLPLVGYAAGGTSARAVADSVAATIGVRRALRRYDPDVAYVRYGLFAPSLRPALRRAVTVVELNSRPGAEHARVGGVPRQALEKLSGRALLHRADGLICVAHAIARDVEGLGVPVRVIANGAALDGAPHARPPGRERPLAAFLGSAPMPWHGIDKLLDLARATPEWDFVLVGVDAADLPGPATPNVRTHPRMPREQYGAILASADVGIGSLAMHRAGLDEASPLKVREYLAHGLPVVIGFEDTDLDDSAWYVLRLPSSEPNVRDGVAEIRRFVEAVRGRRVSPDEIAPLGLRAKETARLQFMAEVAAARG